MISRDDRMAREQAVERLQIHLASIRNLAGWTTTDLADRLGVTKQTIWNLENRNTKMTMIQYIAIRSVIDAEIAAHPEKETLKNAVELFLDADLPEEEQDRVDDMSGVFSHASSAPEETLEKLFSVMFDDIVTTGTAVMEATKEVVEEVADEIPRWMDNVMKAFNLDDDKAPEAPEAKVEPEAEPDGEDPKGEDDGTEEENK
ncbi:MAG: helix-turn-helix transcriptional regulator [Eubacterium sp.]|nr:helix-turn-helix transcriptional regulator [Candidatus Colimonas fimequi]